MSNKKRNKCTYDLESFPWGVGTTSNKRTTFIFDKEDYDKIKKYTWIEHIVMKTYRRIEARESYIDENGNKKYKTIPMHYIITGKLGIDHINKDPMDNRKVNLRFATQEDNRKNHKIRSDNTSGITGVTFLRGKWSARIYTDKTEISIYYGESKEEAIKMRLIYEMIYHPDGFQTHRDMFDKYGITKEYVEEYKKNNKIRKPEDVISKKIDLTGQTINNWLILGKSKYVTASENKPTWDCVCKCQLNKPENEWKHSYLTTSKINSGTPKSCGCLVYKNHPESIPNFNMNTVKLKID